MKIKACKNCKNLQKVNVNKYICKIYKVNIEEIEECILKEENSCQ